MEPAGTVGRFHKLLHALHELRSGLKICEKHNISRSYIIKAPGPHQKIHSGGFTWCSLCSQMHEGHVSV